MRARSAQTRRLPTVGKALLGHSGSRVEFSGGLVWTRPPDWCDADHCTWCIRPSPNLHEGPPIRRVRSPRLCRRASTYSRLIGREHNTHHRRRVASRSGAWWPAGCRIRDGLCVDRGEQPTRRPAPRPDRRRAAARIRACPHRAGSARRVVLLAPTRDPLDRPVRSCGRPARHRHRRREPLSAAVHP
jgi:hypothetical protein